VGVSNEESPHDQIVLWVNLDCVFLSEHAVKSQSQARRYPFRASGNRGNTPGYCFSATEATKRQGAVPNAKYATGKKERKCATTAHGKTFKLDFIVEEGC